MEEQLHTSPQNSNSLHKSSLDPQKGPVQPQKSHMHPPLILKSLDDSSVRGRENKNLVVGGHGGGEGGGEGGVRRVGGNMATVAVVEGVRFICMYTYMYMQVCIWEYSCICILVFTNVCIHVYMHICMYIYVYIHIYKTHIRL